jgi:proliferating cell nuclear antigen
MFEAKLTKAVVLKQIVDAMKELCKEVSFECSDKGIQLQEMDSSHVALMALHMKEGAFEMYRADREKVLGLSVESLTKIFRLCGADDGVAIRHEDDADSVQFVLANDSDDRISKVAVKLLDVEKEQLEVPEMETSVTVKMPSKELARICRDLAQFGDNIIISCTKDGIKFAAGTSTGGDIAAADILVKPRDSEKDAEKVSISCQEPVSATFSVRYLNAFTKATQLSDAVTVQLSDRNLLTVEYLLGDEEGGHLRFYLSPKEDE